MIDRHATDWRAIDRCDEIDAMRRTAVVLCSLMTMWAAAALWFDFPVAWLHWPLAFGYLAFATTVARKRIALWLLSLALVMVWWFSLKPNDNRNWQPDVARLPWAEIAADHATIHNIRNCDYASETNYTPHWETKTVSLSDVRGVDLFLSHWGMDWIAHAIVSFEFVDGSHLATSIEARKTAGQEYSAIRGFFRQFQTLYLISEERDVVRVRTNYRGERVYLYRTQTTPVDARNMFVHYLGWMNQARQRPEWYNAATANCATSFVRYLAQAKVGGISQWDWRTLFVGGGDELLYEKGDLVTGGLPFPELKRRALIQPTGDVDFSRQIRINRPGFAQ
jgi:hypothetical protein